MSSNKKIAKSELNRLNLLVESLFGIKLTYELRFDLKGTCTIGQCRKIGKDHFIIRLHEPLMEHFGLVYINDVLVHELAHAVQMSLYKIKTKPHGKEWKDIVCALQNRPYSSKDKPNFSSYFNLHVKKLKRFKYTCKCENPHFLSIIRHNKVQRKGVKYVCKICKHFLVYS